MTTITEDYVSFETAKLLKEKGFDEKVISFYPPGDIQRPTLQMAMKWLRERHDIAINIGWGEIFEDKFQWWSIILNYKNGSILRDSEYYATYEETVEASINYCLENLI